MRITHIASLVVLAALLALTVVVPTLRGKDLNETQRAQLLRTDDEWIVQYDILNEGEQDRSYLIEVNVDGTAYRQEARTAPNGKFVFIQHIRPEQLTEGVVMLRLFQEGRSEPLDSARYTLR